MTRADVFIIAAATCIAALCVAALRTVKAQP